MGMATRASVVALAASRISAKLLYKFTPSRLKALRERPHVHWLDCYYVRRRYIVPGHPRPLGGWMIKGLPTLLSDATHLILDFDGVVADSEPFFRSSWNHALSAVGHSVSEEDYWLFWSSLGGGLDGELSRSGLELSEVRRHRLREMQRKAYSGYCREGLVPLAPGAGELLDLLSQGDFCLEGWAIASNTDSRLVEEVLKRAEAPLPPLIVGGEGLNRKP